MKRSPYTLLDPLSEALPLIVDSPHSGRHYPEDFHYACPRIMLRHTEDFQVDELVRDAQKIGATVLMAEFPRSYIDVNRAEDDLDPALLATPWPQKLNPTELTKQGLGLVRRLCRSSIPVYAAPLSPEVIEQRLRDYYRPYHQALSQTLEALRAKFGFCFLINCHSWPKRALTDQSQSFDFILGDRDGLSCDVLFIDSVEKILSQLGYSVGRNNPYKGVEIVRRYGQPHKGVHALQLEINRRLYMNEDSLEYNSGFEKLHQDLAQFFTELGALLKTSTAPKNKIRPRPPQT